MFGTAKRFLVIVGLIGLVSGLSACGAVGNMRERVFGVNPTDYGLPFRADLDTGETRREFTVTVRAGGASLAEARESARYPATRHCIERFSLSDVNWDIDPASGDWAVTRQENGNLVVSGQCAGR